MSQSPAQPDLFSSLNSLNAIDGIGVFYFPSTSLSEADQLSVIERTQRRLHAIKESINGSKFQGERAFLVADMLLWIKRFYDKLEIERMKLKQLVDPEFNGQNNGELVEKGVATTLNGHAA